MPVKRNQLSPAQQARYLVRIQELQAAKVNCAVPDDWLAKSHDLDIIIGPAQDSFLCELSTGVTGCAIPVRTVSLCSNLILPNFRIASEWDPELVAVFANAKNLYRVGVAFEFAENETLNHRFEKGLRFRRRGDVAEGYLIACSHIPIPDKYENRMIMKLSVTFTDQFGHNHSAHAYVPLERSKCVRISNSRVGKSSGLFEIGNPGGMTPGFGGEPIRPIGRRPEEWEGAEHQRGR
jgi:hypothetical protein